MHNRRTCLHAAWLVSACLCTAASLEATAAESLGTLTFAADPGELYVPVEEAAQRLGWKMKPDRKGDGLILNRISFASDSFRSLPGGALLVPLSVLEKAGAEVIRNAASDIGDSNGSAGKPQSTTVRNQQSAFSIEPAVQSVEIDLKEQKLRARQGDVLVLETRISSGRRNSTPRGDFHAGPYKAKQHFSSKYNNAPMPWSVQVTGHIFIHGFTLVPDHPASHGCIRLPLTDDNPARFFFEWVEVGTPIRIR